MRAFVITSSGVGEGKAAALNLAYWQHRARNSSTIGDSDLRQPYALIIAELMPVGLSSAGGQLSLEQPSSSDPPAFALCRGRAREDVAEMLSGPTFARVIAEARRMFDYIIIDAPPLGIFTDANVLISRADAALLVVRAGKTRYSQIDKLLEQLPRERVLGVVLNRAEDLPDSSSYYYQQRYTSRNRGLPAEGARALPGETEKEVAIVS